MIIKNKHYEMHICDSTGQLMAMRNHAKRNYIVNTDLPLIKLTLLDKDGNRVNVSSNDAVCEIKKSHSKLVISFINVGSMDINLTATVRFDNSPMTYWGLSIQNNSGLYLEKTDYPNVVVPNDLVGKGGDSKIFWSAFEGVEVDNLDIRETSGYRYRDDAFPAYGWDGRYPGACQTQYLAYYNPDGGLYFAAHDAECNVKCVEIMPVGSNGIKMMLETFTGENDTTEYSYNFEYVLGMFEGDYYDATEIYKHWLMSTDLVQLPKIKDNDKLPKWIYESPVVVMCGLRGHGDSANMDEEVYYPYTNLTPIMRQLSEDFDSKVMSLLCHWEGTAPWAPPYVWPPYKSLENFQQYIEELHRYGNYFALYCSGLAWTNRSGLIPSYSREQQFYEDDLGRFMEVPPNQKLAFSNICGMPIREGYDMCPACEFTREVTAKEVDKIISNLDLDYLQYFDQNLGGNTYMCYSRQHGHAPGPGKWQNEAMLNIIKDVKALLKERGKENVLLGCESNAAEPFVNELLFNDSRHNIGYNVGTPVPAYNFLFHEYTVNFMGNQNSASGVVDYQKYPNNLYYRYAQAFCQGDMLTVVLKDNGKILWDWTYPWDKEDLNQAEFKAFIKELNSWRQNFGKRALLCGKMLKPLKVLCGKYTEEIKWGGHHTFDSILTCRYENEDKGSVQFIVNYLDSRQNIILKHNQDVQIVTDAFGKRMLMISENGEISIDLQPRQVIAVII